MLERIFALLVKEFLQMKRDRTARFRLLVPPILQLIIFGYAATFEVFGVSTVVLDQDHSQESRQLLARFTSSGRFQVAQVADSRREVRHALDVGDATLALVIQPGFAQLLQKGQSAPLQVLVDGTNSNTALIALGYVGQIASGYAQDYASTLAQRRGLMQQQAPPQITLEQRYWYNENLNSRWFFVPGVVATLTMFMVVNLTSFAIVREREVGTLEQIMVTPVRPLEFILGKTVPFFLIGFTEVALITAVALLWFQVPFRGSPLTMVLGASLFLLSALGLGILVSTICRTQQQAFATNFFVLNPLFTLSGFAFPISSMPQALQWVTLIDPLRYFLIVVRGSFLKGIGVSYLWPQLAAMAAIGVVLLGLSALRLQKSID
ncbi:MAG TPA: ABC transporter permease [Burkholderiales bacterium]|nr:ABC transporter permease [Burkholderiales bacterium]